MPFKSIIIKMLVCMLRLLYGVNKNAVTFMCFNGKSYGDNPRTVSEELHREAPDAVVIWLLEKSISKNPPVPDYVQVIEKTSSIAFYKALATTAVYVDNESLPFIPKSKYQLFISLWHGDRAFKKVGYDSTFRTGKRILSEAVDGYCDLAVSGSDYGERQFRSAFRYKGKILMKGTPRDDCLLNPDPLRIAQIKQVVGVHPDTQLLLYAPTLRREYARNGQKQVIQEIDFSRTLTKLEANTGKRWVCAVRAHPSMKGLTGFDPEGDILDLSKYGDMADLLLASDMLITDYSSCAGDFALTGRRLVLYQPDIEAYVEKDRTFYFDMKDSPYLIAHNQEELDAILDNLDEEKAKANCKAILDFYGTHETGHAAEAVVKEILSHLKKS